MLRFILFGIIAFQAVGCAAMDTAVFAARREALMKRIEGSVAVLQGAAEPRAYVPFRQDNNFYYLTGVEEPDALLMLDASQHRSILFLPARDKQKEPWEGPRLVPGSGSRHATGMDAVLDLGSFAAELQKRKDSLRRIHILRAPQETAATSRDRALQQEADRVQNRWDGRVSRAAAFEQNLRSHLDPSVAIEDLAPMLDAMRRVKDSQEIERMREAGRIAALGLKEAMRAAGPDLYEYQLAALAEFVFLWHGSAGYAFYPIVGSGPNSCILHYSRNGRKMLAGDIVVMDFGPDIRYYGADITRTFPVSGKFSEEQAKVYGAVLDAQTAALAAVRPGATFDDVREAASESLKRAGYERFLTHGVSHYVGMSTHDVGKSEPFAPGVVIAVEPGVYLPDKNLGVRIEDTVLVTRDGYEILTREAPKAIADIERLMAGGGLAEGLSEAVKAQ